MQLSQEHQALVDFFLGRELPAGPQHINPYSVFLNVPKAVDCHLQGLYSEVEATQNASARLLQEIKAWLIET